MRQVQGCRTAASGIYGVALPVILIIVQAFI
jgi:hypothetical protein